MEVREFVKSCFDGEAVGVKAIGGRKAGPGGRSKKG